MQLIYFDEVKPNRSAFPDLLIAGVSVSDKRVSSFLSDYMGIRERFLSELRVDRSAEVHAHEIYQGKGPFKAKNIDTRLCFLAEILRLIESKDIKLLFSRVDTSSLYEPDFALEFCFTNFFEIAHSTIAVGEVGMMIGDMDVSSKKLISRRFSGSEQGSSPWSFGQPFSRFIDTIHFADSRICAMVQVADVYAFAYCHPWSQRTGYPANRFGQLIDGIDLAPAKFRCWP